MTREEALQILDTIPTIGEQVDALEMAIEALEQEPKWIPVTERLPKDSGEYLVTVTDVEDKSYLHTDISWFAHPTDYDIEHGEWRELMEDEEIIAWQPLPEPYEESEE